MKIKTDTAIKVLAQYIGHPVIYVGEKELGGQYYPKEKYELSGVREHDTAPFLLSLVGNYVSADKFKVILKPLSQISKKDSDEVVKIMSYKQKDTLKNILYTVKFKILDSTSPEKAIETYQFLQSKGYDMPHYLLGGRTLKEAGLAIYKKVKLKK